jgi:transposase
MASIATSIRDIKTSRIGINRPLNSAGISDLYLIFLRESEKEKNGHRYLSVTLQFHRKHDRELLQFVRVFALQFD